MFLENITNGRLCSCSTIVVVKTNLLSSPGPLDYITSLSNSSSLETMQVDTRLPSTFLVSNKYCMCECITVSKNCPTRWVYSEDIEYNFCDKVDSCLSHQQTLRHFIDCCKKRFHVCASGKCVHMFVQYGVVGQLQICKPVMLYTQHERKLY